MMTMRRSGMGLRATGYLVLALVLAPIPIGPAEARGRHAHAQPSEITDPVAALAALPDAGGGTVSDVADGGTFTLGDGRQVRLAGIEVPLPPLGRRLDTPWSWSTTARKALADLVRGRTVTLRGKPDDIDRYGRQVAQVVRDDGVWIQGALIGQGAVRVETEPDRADLAHPMLALEDGARRQATGIWRSSAYAVRTPEDMDYRSGTFQVVQGTVSRIEDRHGDTCLVFGAGEAAFAACVARGDKRRFLAARLDPADLAGRRLRLRGWVAYRGRSVLDLTHPEQIEMLHGKR